MASRRKRVSKARKPLGKIKRPGALTAQKRPGESTVAAARRLKKSGTPLQKKQANYYLNVLRPASQKRKKAAPKRKQRR